MLGPSDVRKNHLVLMRRADASDFALEQFFRFRLPESMPSAGGASTIEALAESRPDQYGLGTILDAVERARRMDIQRYLRAFLEVVRSREVQTGGRFSYADCAVANCALLPAGFLWQPASIQALLSTSLLTSPQDRIETHQSQLK